MEGLFSSLSSAVGSTPAIALGAAFAWGILSIVLSPCHLAGIPLIVAFVSGGATNGRQAFWLSTVFALGILITLVVISAATAAAGRMLGDAGPWVYFAVGLVLLLVGLQLIGLFPLQWGGWTRAGAGRRGMLAALTLGLIFGAAVGPCTFAYMAPVLAVAFTVAATAFAYALALLAAFALGHCAVIVAAGSSAGLVQQYLDWGERTRAVRVLRGICGVLLLAGAGYTFYLFSLRL